MDVSQEYQIQFIYLWVFMLENLVEIYFTWIVY